MARAAVRAEDARDVDTDASRPRAVATTTDDARDAVAMRAEGVHARVEASTANARDARGRDAIAREGGRAREASTSTAPRQTPRGRADTSRQAMLEALTRELDETESLLGTMKRATAGERATREASSRAGGERYVPAPSCATEARRETARGDATVDAARGATDDATPRRESWRWVSLPKRARWSAATMIACACACVVAVMFAGETPQARARRHMHLSSLSDMRCDVAFVGAMVVGSNDTPINRVIAATDHVYVLTTQNCASVNSTIRVPAEFEGKATCVSGKVLDRCTARAAGVWYDSHYTRVSMSHGMIVKHAKENGFEHITVMEEDAVVNADVTIQDETEADLLTLIAGDFGGESASLGRVKLSSDAVSAVPWKLVRPSVRPHLFEKFEIRKSSTGGLVEVTTGTHDDLVCPAQCHCVNTRIGGQLCRLNAGGCDLRSSDMYLLHNTAYDEMIATLFTGTDDTIIDHYALQNIDSAWLLHPSITTQSKLDIDVAVQHRVQDLFEEKCVR